VIHNILVVDANRALSGVHENLLQQAGYRVATACDMSAVAKQLRLKAVSLVIAELGLPDTDPADPLNVVRLVATLRPGTPILVLTSNTDRAIHRQARKLGVWDISVKPTDCAELLRLTKDIVDAAYPESTGGLGHLLAIAAAAK
jgi:two-component system chemotaxis response regulator CheY